MTLPATRPGITKAEVAKLLAFIAAYDQRTVGEADVEAWHMVAVAGRWTFPCATRAVVEFTGGRPDDRIRPGHISQIIQGRRERYAATFHHPGYPRAISGDPAREIDFDRQAFDDHVRACMQRWAAGEEN